MIQFKTRSLGSCAKDTNFRLVSGVPLVRNGFSTRCSLSVFLSSGYVASVSDTTTVRDSVREPFRKEVQVSLWMSKEPRVAVRASLPRRRGRARREQVTRAPLVAVLSTGDEVREPSPAALPPGAIRDANRPMLLAAAAEAGAKPMDLGIVPDSAGLPGLEAALHTAVEGGADVLITSGAPPPPRARATLLLRI